LLGTDLKIGYLVPGIIVKSLPDKDASLVLIMGTEVLALLPKKYARQSYRVGDNLVAAVFQIEDTARQDALPKIFLSQKSPQFFKKIAELAFAELIEAGKIKIKRVAVVENGGFVKVAVEKLDGVDPVSACIPLLSEVKKYTDHTFTIVGYSTDMEEYIKDALRPAPKDKIGKVIYRRMLKEATVRVVPEYLGLFLGKGGANVSTAAKLLGITITVKKAEN